MRPSSLSARCTTHLHSPSIPGSLYVANMLSRSTVRVASHVQKRAFSATRARLSSPYHYPEGPRSNIPFNPLTKFFAVRYWTFMAVGFGAPFGVAVWQTKKNQ